MTAARRWPSGSAGIFGQATARAGAIATGIGRVMILGGIALLILAASPGGIWLALIGWFVVVAARAETSYGVAHDALAGLRVSDATIWQPLTVPAELSAERFLDELFAATRYASYPVMSHGSIVGLLAVGDIAGRSAEELERLRVSDLMVAPDESLILRHDLDLAEGTAELLSTALGRALVTRDGEVKGLISLSDVERILDDRTASLSYPSAARRPPTRPRSLEQR